MKRLIILLIFIILLTPVSVDAGIFSCNSCGDCTNTIKNEANTGDIVELTENISVIGSTCISWAKTGIILDCKNHRITSDNIRFSLGTGINIQSGNNNEIRNCQFYGSGIGIHLSGSLGQCTGNNIHNNNFFDPFYIPLFYGGTGILDSCGNTNIFDNTFSSLSNGIYLYKSTGSKVQRNTAERTNTGIVLDSAKDSYIESNTACQNADADIKNFSSLNIFASNNKCDKTINFHDIQQPLGCASGCSPTPSDTTPPTLIDYSVAGCDYKSKYKLAVVFDACWVRPNTNAYFNITHFDDGSTPFIQFINFTRQVGSEEISAYVNVDTGSLKETSTSINHLTIENARCAYEAGCDGEYARIEWIVKAGNPSSRYFIQTKMIDQKGNNASNLVFWVLSVDNSSPIVSLKINNDAQATNNRQVKLNITIIDPQLSSGIKDCKIWDNGQHEPLNWGPCPATSGSVDWTLSPPASPDPTEEDRTVYIKVRDNVSYEIVAQDSIFYDTKPPDSSMTGLSKDNDLTADTYSNSRTVWAVGLGNTGWAVACQVSWERISVKGNSVDIWTAEFPAADESKSYTYKADGYNSSKYRCRDAAGNWDLTPAVGTITIDTVAPETSDNSDTEWHGGNFLLTLTCEDMTSKCNKTEYCELNKNDPVSNCNLPGGFITGNITTLFCPSNSICEKIVYYKSTDNAGNVGALKQTETIKMNTKLPTCTIASLPQYTNSQNIVLSLSASDPVGRTIIKIKVNVSRDGAFVETKDITTNTLTYTGENNHTYSFACSAVNSLNEEGAPSSTISTFVDTQAPTASINIGQWTSQNPIILPLESNDFGGSGLSCYDVQWFNSSASTWHYIITDTGPSQCIKKDFVVFNSSNTPITSNVTYTFRVRATDNAGNMGQYTSFSTKTDFVAPSCSISAERISQGDFTAKISGTDDNSGIEYYDIEINQGGDWASLPGGNRFTGSELNFSITSESIFKLRCSATDKAGNTGSWVETQSLIYDKTPPVISSVTYNQSVEENQTVNVRAVVTDNLEVKDVVLKYSGSTIPIKQTIRQEPKLWEVLWEITNQQAGVNEFDIQVYDSIGNAVSASYNFTQKCASGSSRECGNPYGICKGIIYCTNGAWGKCLGSLSPVPEVCNAIDDDCDGKIDEDVARSCGDDEGVCKSGLQYCANGSWSAVCVGEVKSSDEVCDNLDNDCNGVIDEGCSCIERDTQPCGETKGICEAGKQTCVNGRWGDCKGGVKPKPAEVCNDPIGLDDDCDGQIDEGLNCGANNVTCSNDIQDGDEEGVDCGGSCPNACGVIFDYTLIIAGVIILIVLGGLVLYFKKNGKELTWAELTKRWSGGKEEGEEFREEGGEYKE